MGPMQALYVLDIRSSIICTEQDAKDDFKVVRNVNYKDSTSPAACAVLNAS